MLRVVYNTINPVFGTRVPSRSYSLVLDLNQSLVEAAILFVDEPTASLDPILRRRFQKEFEQLREGGAPSS